VLPCRLVHSYQRYEVALSLHFQRLAVQEQDCWNLKQEAARSSETSVNYLLVDMQHSTRLELHWPIFGILMFDKMGKRNPYCRHICGYPVTDLNRNKKSIRVDSFHKVPVIMHNDQQCEYNLTLWSSYLSCDYTAVTYKGTFMLTPFPLSFQNDTDLRAHDIATLET
jgi:hypothetical protein